MIACSRELPLRRQGDAPRVRSLRVRAVEFVVRGRNRLRLGARQQRTKGGFATKRQAVAALNGLQQSALRGTYVAPSKFTVGEYLERQLPSARARLRPGAYDACALHVRAYIAPRIGDIPLQALTPTKVKSLCAELRKAVRRRRGALPAKNGPQRHGTLSRALGDAVADRLLLVNPAERARRQPESPEMPTWSAEQLRTFLDHVTDGHHTM